MPEAVRGGSYDNPRRQARVRATRAQVAAAALGLFIERGYSATTIEAIAAGSDTPIATLYPLFGSKRGILNQFVGIPFGGDETPLPLPHPPARPSGPPP